MIEGESTRVWCRTCAGYAEYKLGTLLSSRCKGQPAKEHDRRHTMYRVTKLEEGCEPTRETADRRPNGPRTVNCTEYERVRDDRNMKGFSCREAPVKRTTKQGNIWREKSRV